METNEKTTNEKTNARREQTEIQRANSPLTSPLFSGLSIGDVWSLVSPEPIGRVGA